MAENFSLQIKKSETDEWYTPKEAVEIILPYLAAKGFKKILCPFDKEESWFVKVLQASGFDVSHSHIETGTDFFGIENLREYDAVVSNPPFSKRQKILEKLYESGVPFAMILNFNGLFDSKARWEIFKSNRFEIIVPKGRIHFFNDSCDGNSPNFQSVYLCSGVCENQIEFAEMRGKDGRDL